MSPADAKSGDGFAKLKATIGDSDRIRVFYMAVAPALFGDIATSCIRDNGWSHRGGKADRPRPRLGAGAERPDRRGLRRAPDLPHRPLSRQGDGAEPDGAALRQRLFEPLWNSAHIDHVQITVAETVGLEDRVTYYDTAGALRDMVQNHILQLLCLSPWSRRPRWTPTRCATRS
jgi:glucose-6-phosphate 1-dehydrogenase